MTGLVGGLLANIVEAEDQPSDDTASASPVRSPDAASKLQAFVDQSLDVVHSIWGWLVIGVIISAAITNVVPPNSLSEVGALTGIWALLVTLVISLPLYVCATASVPIAAALVDSGLPPGAALVFLMAGPATNVATLGAVYRTLGYRSLIVYLTTIVVGSVAAGLAFNQVIDTSVTLHHAHDHLSWWRIFCGAVLAAMIAWFAMGDALRLARKRNAGRLTDDQSITMHVDGMTCDGCAARLERILESSEAIDRADASFAESRVTVFGTDSRDVAAEAVQAAGFSVRDGAMSAVEE